MFLLGTFGLFDFVNLAQPIFGQNIMLVTLLVQHFHVIHVFVDNQSQIGGESPGSGGPTQHSSALVEQREAHDDGGISEHFVALGDFEVAEHRGTSVAVRHHPEPPIDHVLVVNLLEHSPNTLHELQVEGFVVVVEVDPPPESLGGFPPLLGVPLDHRPAFRVVLSDSHLNHLLPTLDPQLLVGQVLDRQSMAIPPEFPFYVVAFHSEIAGDYVLNCAGSDMSVVGRPGGERGSIKESVFRLVFC